MSSDAAKLVHAAMKGNDAKVRRLLKAKADANAFDTEAGWTRSALLSACGDGHVGVARLLLKAGATVNLCDPSGR